MEILFSNNQSYKNTVKHFFEKENPLINDDMDEIIDTLDAISKYWLSKNFKMKDIFINNSLGFIIPWLNKKNSLELLKLNFENYKSLNGPNLFLKKSSKMFCRPCGTALHWMAGNVPVISMISLFQGILTKNKNVIKVSKTFKVLLPNIFKDLKKNFKKNHKSKKILNNILNSLLIVYVEHEDELNLNILSKSSDVRIIWGGEKAVTKIAKLPKKINCRDIIFGPKVSMAYVSKKKIGTKENIKKFSDLFVNDVFNFSYFFISFINILLLYKGFSTFAFLFM